MYQPRRRGVVALLALLLACGSGDPEAGERDAREPEPQAPRRIACWGAELCDLLVELGLGPRIVAADTGSLARPELAHAADLGDAAPSPEALRAVAPELVLVLAQEGLALPESTRVHRFAPDDANAIPRAILRIGALTGTHLRARALTARMAREVSEIATRRDGLPRRRAVWLIGREPWVAVGGAGLLHQILELAGAENAFHDPPQPRRVVSAEEIEATVHDVVLGRDVPVDPALSALPALDLAGRVRALHELLYPPQPRGDFPQGTRWSDRSSGGSRPGR